MAFVAQHVASEKFIAKPDANAAFRLTDAIAATQIFATADEAQAAIDDLIRDVRRWRQWRSRVNNDEFYRELPESLEFTIRVVEAIQLGSQLTAG